MDIIFHRNCLDGAFSSYLAYLTSKLINQDQLDSFVQSIKSAIQTLGNDITKYQPQPQLKTANPTPVQITQDFFHTLGGVQFNAYSFFAGEYYPLKFPNKAKVLLILDTHLTSSENIKNACTSHELVILIDHHTSFKDIKNEVESIGIKNLGFVFEEGRCAAKLVFDFFKKTLKIDRRLMPIYKERLTAELTYVSANDTKIGENRESKAFVLGFYYFEIELSHTNPNLYKRIGLMDLQYLLQRGKNLYKTHLQEICEQVKNAKVAQFVFQSNRFKSKRCLYLQPSNANKISDIGIVLAYLSSQFGMENLALLVMKREEVRVSCRSHRNCKDAAALQIAKMFEGGGHTEAAGFKISQNRIKSAFKVHSLGKFGLKIQLGVEDIEEIIFK